MRIALAGLCALLFAGPALAGDPPEWTRPTPPFRIVGPIYYVGTEGLGAYLIASSHGLVLIDGTLAQNVPQIERNIEALGFRLRDVKLLLNNHAHDDHAAGLAQLKRDTGAPLMASLGDRGALEAGRAPSDTSYAVRPFPPVKVDRTVIDGRSVTLGDVTLMPTLTPGHTPGCTTWRTTVVERGRRLDVVFLCSITVAGNVLVGNRGYPGIARDFRGTFRRIAGMHADVVLPGHPEAVDLMERERRRQSGDADAFLMPGLLAKLDADAERDFNEELAAEQARRH